MGYRSLYILVEGPDDTRFFQRILIPQFLKQGYSYVKTVEYSSWNTQKLHNFIFSCHRMSADYIYVADNDGAPCVTFRKNKILARANKVDLSRIAIVVEEIESWYLAGLADERMTEFGFPRLATTDRISKEQFHRYLRDSKRFTTRVECMLNILNVFSTEIARKRNTSFDYFMNKFTGA
ncbi:MAG: hypothetical protein D6681_17110 [Calditrichaeota bacterium]|nr:MAG: hypothetical protein D6681_17110 [Calditrichota bacterium]